MEFKEINENNNFDILINKVKENDDLCSILNFVDKNYIDFVNYSQIPFYYLKKQKKENNEIKLENIENENKNKNENENENIEEEYNKNFTENIEE